MASSIMYSDDFLTCTVCHKGLNQPCLLPCFHTFCLTCFMKHAEKCVIKKAVDCPTCRTPVKLPAEGAVDLPQNHFVTRLQREMSEKIAQGVMCDCCHGTKGEYRCFRCQEYLCGKCYDAHKLTTVTRDHYLICLKDLQRTRLSERAKNPSSDIQCPRHSGQVYEKYCASCDQPICQQCEATNHNSHKTSSFSNEASKMRASMKEALQPLSMKLGALQKMTSDCQTTEKQLSQATTQVVEDIRKHAEELRDFITKHEMEKLKQVFDIRDNNQEELKETQDEIVKQQSALVSAHQFTGRMLKHGTDMELAIARADYMKQITLLKGIDSHLKVNITRPVFKTQGNYSSQTKPLMGHLVVNSMSNRPQVIRQFDLQINPTQDWLRAMHFNQDGDLIIGVASIKAYKNKVVIIKNNGKQHSFKTGHLSGLAIQHDGNVAVVDKTEKKIHIYTLQGTTVRSFKCKSTGGLAITGEEEYIIAGADVIVIHKKNGEVEMTIPNKSRKERRAEDIQKHVAFNRENNTIIVSDVCDSTVKVYDTRGQLSFQYGEQGEGEGQLRIPEGACVDNDGNVLIADRENHRIPMLTSCGQFIKYLLLPQDGVEQPKVLAVNQEGNLAVGDRKGVVRIYDYS